MQLFKTKKTFQAVILKIAICNLKKKFEKFWNLDYFDFF